MFIDGKFSVAWLRHITWFIVVLCLISAVVLLSGGAVEADWCSSRVLQGITSAAAGIGRGAQCSCGLNLQQEAPRSAVDISIRVRKY